MVKKWDWVWQFRGSKQRFCVKWGIVVDRHWQQVEGEMVLLPFPIIFANNFEERKITIFSSSLQNLKILVCPLFTRTSSVLRSKLHNPGSLLALVFLHLRGDYEWGKVYESLEIIQWFGPLVNFLTTPKNCNRKMFPFKTSTSEQRPK